jgi:hypothetical protein
VPTGHGTVRGGDEIAPTPAPTSTYHAANQLFDQQAPLAEPTATVLACLRGFRADPDSPPIAQRLQPRGSIRVQPL